eukprot:TRINITY_DN8342_c0_g1_i1.p1 TRINITY_DN8342_c0_g1~~TRINITY_DN8342_c0_g1_i1.p1  ORF type:complete len:327 (+),score=15.81 TRINITY_DN8342_c0_g1_i1:1-981(+)
MGNETSKDWLADDEVHYCPLCQREFSAFLRKHHCRFCGGIFCETCSTKKGQPARGCITCVPIRSDLCRTVDNLLSERFKLLWDNAPASFLDEKMLKSCQSVKEVAGHLGLSHSKKAHFLADLIVAGTRVWECFKKKSDGSLCFPGLPTSTLYRMVQDDALRIYTADMREIDFSSVPSADLVVQRAFQSLHDHIGVIRRIEPTINLEEFNQFLSQLQIFKFGPAISLYGLSSMQGTRVYIWEALLSQDPDLGKETLEHEICHALPRWQATTLSSPNPRLISPEKNPELRSRTGAMIEAGDFYEQEVYARQPSGSPFCLVVPSWRGYY